MSSNQEQERRRATRRRTFKGAQISFHGLDCAIDCVVRNYSETGARLTVASSVGIPDDFHLAMDGAPVRLCRLVWRSATQLGVAFLE